MAVYVILHLCGGTVLNNEQIIYYVTILILNYCSLQIYSLLCWCLLVPIVDSVLSHSQRGDTRICASSGDHCITCSFY